MGDRMPGGGWPQPSGVMAGGPLSSGACDPDEGARTRELPAGEAVESGRKHRRSQGSPGPGKSGDRPGWWLSNSAKHV